MIPEERLRAAIEREARERDHVVSMNEVLKDRPFEMTDGSVDAADFARELLEWREMGEKLEMVHLSWAGDACPVCEWHPPTAGHDPRCKLGQLLGKVHT